MKNQQMSTTPPTTDKQYQYNKLIFPWAEVKRFSMLGLNDPLISTYREHKTFIRNIDSHVMAIASPTSGWPPKCPFYWQVKNEGYHFSKTLLLAQKSAVKRLKELGYVFVDSRFEIL